MLRFIFVVIVLLIVAIYYAFRIAGGYKWVRGSGVLVMVSETVDPFDQIDVHHGFDLKVIEGDSYDITIELDDNLVDLLGVYTEGSCLHIGLQKDIVLKRGTLRALVTTNGLKAIKAAGATKVNVADAVVDRSEFKLKLSGASAFSGVLHSDSIQIKNSGAVDTRVEIEASTLEVKLSGATEFKASGHATNVEVISSGASSIKAGLLRAAKASLNLSGASSLKMKVDEYLEVTASGGSDILIDGHPRVGKQNVGTASNVKFR